MKRLRTLLLTALISLPVLAIAGPGPDGDCEPYFPMEEGTVMEMTTYNAKDKEEGSSKIEVTEKRNEGGKLIIAAETTVYDKKGEETATLDYTAECEDGVFRFDMSNMMSSMQMDNAMAGMENMEIEVESDYLVFPKNPTVGQELEGGTITTTVSGLEGMPAGMGNMMNTTTTIMNRKVEAIEDVTTPAGTFSCVKISYDIQLKSMMTIQTSAVEWVAKDVGVVRSESYNKKGKLQSYTELTSFSK